MIAPTWGLTAPLLVILRHTDRGKTEPPISPLPPTLQARMEWTQVLVRMLR